MSSRSYCSKIFVYLFALLVIGTQVTCGPVALFSDPAMTHNIWGSNPPAVRKDKITSNLYITPFYQTAHDSTGARNKFGSRVPTGDRLGRWNMFGLFFNAAEGAPLSKPFNATNYPTLFAANTALAATNKDYTDESLFEADNDGDGKADDGHYSVPISYEKIGIRLGLMFTSGAGFGFAIKGGFAEYSQAPTFNDQTLSANPDSDDIDENLMDPTKRREIARELGFKKDMRCFTSTAVEDTHAQIHWTYPLEFKDVYDAHIVSVIPYLAVGVWIPTGQERDQDIAFSLPMGNDGFTGFTVEGALNFEFQDLTSKAERQFLQFGGGVAATFFDTRDLEDYRVPTSTLQRGIFPWKTTVQRRLGTVWKLYATLKALMFIEGLSFYADYVYTRHTPDSFTIKDEDPTRAEIFTPELLEQDSIWRVQTVQAGFDYFITRNLSFGGGLQIQFSGRRAYRPTTLLGQVNFSF